MVGLRRLAAANGLPVPGASVGQLGELEGGSDGAGLMGTVLLGTPPWPTRIRAFSHVPAEKALFFHCGSGRSGPLIEQKGLTSQ
jgi:hypothetical protein